jgi:2-polyprenyl-3-methyl-5-hydroxy-6-metoxy-1,4-benzoquinol methylase
MPSEPEEQHRLESIAVVSTMAAGPNEAMVRYSAEVFARYWRPGRCLELGPAEGVMTEILVATFRDLTAVDGAPTFCRDLAARHPSISVVCSLFEDYTPDAPFDTILMGHVLEHVDDPRQILDRARTWLAPAGVLIAAVPNALSLHRQAAVTMGMLSDVHDFSPADHEHGHRRVYDVDLLREDVAAAGLSVDTIGGYWLKPVSNAQIAESWTPEMLGAFMRLGEAYPDIAAEIYVVAHA